MCRASLASRAFGLAVALVVAGSATAQAEPTARAEIPTLWLGAALTQDMPFVSGDDVCSKQQQLEGGFTCFRASGSQYHGTPVPGQNDRLNPGFVVGTTRVELGVDYALGDPVTLGARVGYVLRGGGPGPDGGEPFIPLSAELHLSYWVLGPAHRPSGVQPYILAKGGATEIDGAFQVTVVEDQSAPPPPNQPDNPPSQELDGYKKMGAGFAGLGAGFFLPAGAAHGPSLELCVVQLFPSTGTALTLSLGWSLGL